MKQGIKVKERGREGMGEGGRERGSKGKREGEGERERAIFDELLLYLLIYLLSFYHNNLLSFFASGH